MPKMVHPETGGSFECPDRQVDAWRESGWLLESEVSAKSKSRTSAPSSTATESADADNPEEKS